MPLSLRFAPLALSVCAALPAQPPAPVDFDRDVRPILADTCFACHGPDSKHRKAKLRLDTRAGAFAPRAGHPAIVAGHPDRSELVRRITHADPEERMPPAESGKTLTPDQRALLVRWIEEGAAWAEHWAFAPPVAPAVPSDDGWSRNEIDRFVRAQMGAAGLRPSPEADRRTLIRRLTLDLTGLPPTPDAVEAFARDPDPGAYEALVDRLLATPQYAEHMAHYWLDAARYGDTHGLHLDNYREMWLYRDWVIRAFAANMPFDRFALEQLAGDMLPDATLDQQIASGFNRCHVTTNEGGSIEEEVYVRNVIDRVSTTGTVFMGLTLGCAVCHDHKFDGIEQKEFYQLFAFFNNLDGKPMDGNAKAPAPVVRVPTPEIERELAGLRAEREGVLRRIRTALAQVDYEEPPAAAAVATPKEPADYLWIDDEAPPGAQLQGDGRKWRWVGARRKPDARRPEVHSGKRSLRRGGKGLIQDFFTGATRPLLLHAGDRLFAHVWLDPQDPPKAVQLQFHVAGSWEHRARWGAPAHGPGNPNGGDHVAGPVPAAGRWVRLEVELAAVGLKAGEKIDGWAFTQVDGTVFWDAAGVHTAAPPDDRYLTSLRAWEQLAAADGSLPAPVREAAKVAPGARTPEQGKALADHYLRHVFAGTRAVFDPLHTELAAIDKKVSAAEGRIPTTLVMKERAAPRPAFLLKRGQYDQRGEQVSRDTPSILPPMAADLPRDRLGLARWLIDPGHPLTARVTVNRFWQQLFGTGIVKTSEDFGNQGARPSHPALLDWLATRFVADGWDVKEFMRRVVTSATYRQGSRATPEGLARDPENRLLARGPRYRLDAEVLRDQALALSGLLVEEIGGPGVKPPQPDGLWKAVGYVGSNTDKFRADTGHEKVHRRSLYTFFKRTAPPPQMSTFDAPSREDCRVRRERTNTPLQALLLMNDPQLIEAARHLAQRMLREGGRTDAERAAWGFALATAHPPAKGDLEDMLGLLRSERDRFRHDSGAAKALIETGPLPPDPDLDPVELAGWTMVGNLILNLDAVLTRS